MLGGGGPIRWDGPDDLGSEPEVEPSVKESSRGLLFLAAVGALLAWAVSQFTHEHFSALALLVSALCVYALGARYYSRFIAHRVLSLDDGRATPAHRLRDHRDYMPFKRWTLFGMHFAWIAGPGPLIGPTLAAQFGFLPGFLWIVLGAVLMGAVQDMVILVFSTRRDGMSLAGMIKEEVGPFAGFIASLGVLFILEILLGVLALFVVNALKGSPWGTFTIGASIPIAFLVGLYMTRFRPGHEGEATAVGVVLLLLATAGGRYVAESATLKGLFTLTDVQLALAIVIYGFLASALPAWMLLAPRDNISAYLKVGTVCLLAAGIFFARPEIRMPAVTSFVDGSGPVFGGAVFPFCFIVIACGAISGFHSLISSGTTPRFVDRESDMRVIGYGAMLTESFVAVMALIASITLLPGVYLAMNIPAPPGANNDGTLPPAVAAAFTEQVSSFGPSFHLAKGEMENLAAEVEERSLYNRAGGGPSLAMGMADIFSRILRGRFLAFWYHFAIMFEAVFILTVLDSGTRVIRFVVHDLVHDLRVLRAKERTRVPVWVTSGLAVLGWGLILSWGILDREGGTKALIRMFGTANQLLAVIALSFATVVMLKRHRAYAWVTGIPLVVVGGTTLTAAFLAIFSPDPRVGALSAARDALVKAGAGLLPPGAAVVASHNALLTALLTGAIGLFVLTVLAAAGRRMVSLLWGPEVREAR
jgi:carbon starvation protein